MNVLLEYIDLFSILPDKNIVIMPALCLRCFQQVPSPEMLLFDSMYWHVYAISGQIRHLFGLPDILY